MSDRKHDTVITSFLLVRHAESEANAGAYFGSQSDSKLNDKGKLQVAALTAALRDLAIDAVYSSDLSRALDTVSPLAAARNLAVVATDRLRERAMGELTGLSFEQARERYPEMWRELVARTPTAAPPGGESHVDLYNRVAAVLDELAERHRGGVVLIGSHGVAINHMLRHLLGLHDHTLPVWFAVDNASVSRVDLHQRTSAVAPRLTYVNRVTPIDGASVVF